MGRPKLALDIARQRERVRFWSKVDKAGENDCWLWTGGSVRTGYGQFHVYERHKVQAHRYAYEQLVGPVPEGLTIDHLCRVPLCVNPRHLEPVTNRVNLLRGTGASARNAKKTHCPHGHPYDEDNTYIRYDGRRACRICQRKWGREKMRRRRIRARAAA